MLRIWHSLVGETATQTITLTILWVQQWRMPQWKIQMVYRGEPTSLRSQQGYGSQRDTDAKAYPSGEVKQIYKGTLEAYFPNFYETRCPLSWSLSLFLPNRGELDFLVGLPSHSLASWWSTLAVTVLKKNLQVWLEKRSRNRENFTQQSTNENLSPFLIMKN